MLSPALAKEASMPFLMPERPDGLGMELEADVFSPRCLGPRRLAQSR